MLVETISIVFDRSNCARKGNGIHALVIVTQLKAQNHENKEPCVMTISYTSYIRLKK